MPRNPRPAWRGIGGRHAAESGAGIGRNTQNPDLLWERLKELVLACHEGGSGYCSFETFASRVADVAGSDWLLQLASEYEHLFLLVHEDDEALQNELLGLAAHQPSLSFFSPETNEVLKRHRRPPAFE